MAQTQKHDFDKGFWSTVGGLAAASAFAVALVSEIKRAEKEERALQARVKAKKDAPDWVDFNNPFDEYEAEHEVKRGRPPARQSKLKALAMEAIELEPKGKGRPTERERMLREIRTGLNEIVDADEQALADAPRGPGRPFSRESKIKAVIKEVVTLEGKGKGRPTIREVKIREIRMALESLLDEDSEESGSEEV